MIIAGFGDTVASMYTFPISMMEDDHRLARPSALKAVPLSSGALDVRGSTKNLRAGQIIGKRFVLATDQQPVYSSATKTITTSATHSGNLGHISIVPGSLVVNDSGGTGEDDGLGVIYDSALSARGTVDYGTGAYTLTEDFFGPVVSSIDYSYQSDIAYAWADLGTALDALRAATIAIGRSKLWALMRDGTYRWTWAKCVSLRAPEKVGNIHHCDVSLSFKVDDPVWYSENAHTGSLSSGSNALTNAGNVLTPVIVRLTAVGSACTAFEFRNNDDVNRVTFAGSVAAGKVFTIDGGKRSGKNDGAAAYSTLTIVGAGPWLYLPAGVSGIKWQSSTGGSPTATYEYYDAWEM